MHTEEQLFRWCRECLMILFTLKVCVQSVGAKGELGDTSLCLCASVCVCVCKRGCAFVMQEGECLMCFAFCRCAASPLRGRESARVMHGCVHLTSTSRLSPAHLPTSRAVAAPRQRLP